MIFIFKETNFVEVENEMLPSTVDFEQGHANEYVCMIA